MKKRKLKLNWHYKKNHIPSLQVITNLSYILPKLALSSSVIRQRYVFLSLFKDTSTRAYTIHKKYWKKGFKNGKFMSSFSVRFYGKSSKWHFNSRSAIDWKNLKQFHNTRLQYHRKRLTLVRRIFFCGTYIKCRFPFLSQTTKNCPPRHTSITSTSDSKKKRKEKKKKSRISEGNCDKSSKLIHLNGVDMSL